MTVGLPGAGISAFFYLACALLMPFVALYRLTRGRPVHPGGWPMIGRQFFIGVAILGVILITGWTISTLLEAAAPSAEVVERDLLTTATESASRVAVWIGLGTLLTVLLLVRLASWWLGRRDPRPGAGANGGA